MKTLLIKTILLPVKIIMYFFGGLINIIFDERVILFGNDTIIDYYRILEYKLLYKK